MAQVPSNPKLWNMLVVQAKSKFRVYPSPAASHWVHAEYTKKGGQFVESKKDVKDRDEKSKDRKRTSR